MRYDKKLEVCEWCLNIAMYVTCLRHREQSYIHNIKPISVLDT